MKPKVLYILHLPPPVHGAAMVGEQIRRSRLISESFEGRFINLSASASLEDIGRWSAEKLRTILRLRKTVRRELRAFRPDLVYFTATSSGMGFLKDFPLVQMVKRMGYPVVVHFHNKGVSRRKDLFFRALYRRFFRDVTVMLLSERLYPDIAAYVPSDRVLYCPNGTEDPGPTERKEQEVPHLLFCSNLIESKGILTLLDACKCLKERGESFILDMAGGESAGFSAVRLQQEIAARRLQEEVIFHGRVGGASKEEVYRNADIFVLPTFYLNECFPLVVLEAMARSLPVVSTHEGAIPAMVADGETGLIVPAKDATALADALQKLLADRAWRKKMGEKGRAPFLSEYTLGRFEERFIESLNHCLN